MAYEAAGNAPWKGAGLLRDPESMEQNSYFPADSDDGSFFGVLPAWGCETQAQRRRSESDPQGLRIL